MLPNGQSTIHCINTTKPYWVMHWILIYPNLNLISYKYYWMCMHDLKLVGFHVPVQKSVCFCKLFFLHCLLPWLQEQNAQSDFLKTFLKSFLHSFSYGQGHSPSFHTQLLWCTHSSEELRNQNDVSTAPQLLSCHSFYKKMFYLELITSSQVYMRFLLQTTLQTCSCLTVINHCCKFSPLSLWLEH